VARPADGATTTGVVTGGQAIIPASQTTAPGTSPEISSSAGETPTPKPRPDR
jgi:hypothetical protein